MLPFAEFLFKKLRSVLADFKSDGIIGEVIVLLLFRNGCMHDWSVLWIPDILEHSSSAKAIETETKTCLYMPTSISEQQLSLVPSAHAISSFSCSGHVPLCQDWAPPPTHRLARPAPHGAEVLKGSRPTQYDFFYKELKCSNVLEL